jgi:hypothetical protein
VPPTGSSRSAEINAVQLPDVMPDGCNFYAMLQTELGPAAVAQRFADAGWDVVPSGGHHRLDIGWGRLTLADGSPMVLQGWIDRPDERVGQVLGLLGGPGVTAVSQWVNAAGQVWREMPFDASMLDPDDPRLPADIKESVRANLAGPAPRPRKPWWRFW